MKKPDVPKNVLHILGTGAVEGTGIARIVAALSKGLSQERYRVHAWFLAGDGPLVSELGAAGACVSSVTWSDGMRDPIGAWTFWRKLCSEDFAIVHQHFGGRAPRWLAKHRRARVISHLHAHFSGAHGLSPKSIRSSGAELVIATSQAVADCVVGPQVRVIYPGVDVPLCPSAWKAPHKGKEIVVGTAGRLVTSKGIAYLIRAFAALRDFTGIRLEIAGAGPERASLEREAELQGLPDRIRFLGWHSDVAALMARWDVYVQPSLGEPFGIAALEAMAAGLPVIGTRAGGLPELIEDGRTGWLVPPCDPPALAACLRTLLAEPDLRARMGAAGRMRAMEGFSNAQMIRSISAIYDEVLKGPTDSADR